MSSIPLTRPNVSRVSEASDAPSERDSSGVRDISETTSETSETSWAEQIRGVLQDVKVLNPERMSSLAIQVTIGGVWQIKSLIERRCDPNVVDPDGDRRPLHWAAARGQVRCVNALIKAGADPNIPDASGRTPSVLARRLGNDNIAMRLEQGLPLPDPKQVFEGLYGPSLHAALNQKKRLSWVVKGPTCDPNLRDCDGDRTALHWAAARGHARCVRLLLDARASPHAVDVNGRTPADLASEARHGEVHALLLSRAEATLPWYGLASAPRSAIPVHLHEDRIGVDEPMRSDTASIRAIVWDHRR